MHDLTVMITLSFFSVFVTEGGEMHHQYVDNSPKSSCTYGDVYVKKCWEVAGDCDEVFSVRDLGGRFEEGEDVQ